MYFNDRTGRGVRVAVVDSGIYAAHPHVGGVVDGAAILPDGSVNADFLDRLGHGTAVAAAIRDRAPDVSLVAIKIFWSSLAANVASLVRGIDEACERGAALINLSLGTRNPAHVQPLAAAVARARSRGAIVVAAVDDQNPVCLPGSLDEVLPVCLDWDCPREEYRIVHAGARTMIGASGYPRDAPDVPRERNLKGTSFAVANAAGYVARAIEAAAGSDLLTVLRMLEVEASRESSLVRGAQHV
jgi:subtilisin family serine protease